VVQESREQKKKRKINEDEEFEVVPMEKLKEESDDSSEFQAESDLEDRAESLAIGKVISLSKKRKRAMIDDSYNKYANNDRELAPAWFVDDENKHNVPFIPVSKEDIEEMKARERLINARPIKKVAEAKARKKKRNVQKIAKVREKASVIAAQADMTDIEKIRNIQQLYKKVGKNQKNTSVYIVRNKFQTKGTKTGKGVKSRKGTNIKLVDPRLKKDKKGQARKEARTKDRKRQKRN